MSILNGGGGTQLYQHRVTISDVDNTELYFTIVNNDPQQFHKPASSASVEERMMNIGQLPFYVDDAAIPANAIVKTVKLNGSSSTIYFDDVFDMDSSNPFPRSITVPSWNNLLVADVVTQL